MVESLPTNWAPWDAPAVIVGRVTGIARQEVVPHVMAIVHLVIAEDLVRNK